MTDLPSDTPPDTSTRGAERRRITAETDIFVALNLDSLLADTSAARINTSVPFLDHMLTSFARHGRLSLRVVARGDTEVDDHHTVEDIGLVLGQVILEALGERRGITRFGYAYAPMDEALARAIVDISGRPYLVYETASVLFPERVGRFDTSLVEEFWRAFATEARVTLHLDVLRARNAHHAFEALFKATGLAIWAATRPRADDQSIPSTKGVLG